MDKRAEVLNLVEMEMNRTDENISHPTTLDYMADIARWFNRLVIGDED